MGNYCEKLGEMIPDNLIASIRGKEIVGSGVLPPGTGALKRGTVLAVAEGALSVLGSADGAVPYGILCQDVTVEDTEEVVEIYLTGSFHRAALVVAEGYQLTAEDIQALRNGGIFVENMVPLAGTETADGTGENTTEDTTEDTTGK